MDFGFYHCVSYRSKAGLGELSMGRWLGVSHKVGQLMSYWILTPTRRIVSCVTVQRMIRAEMEAEGLALRMKEFDANIIERLETQDHDIQ